MRFFSDEEFDRIYTEIVLSEYVCFDTLLEVSENVLRNSVRKWCNNDSVLRGRRYEDDIMQEIKIRLVKHCVTGFFLRGGKPNYDPDGFGRWLFTVAMNTKKDFAKKARRIYFEESEQLDDAQACGYDGGLVTSDESIDRLNKAFLLVIESDASVYKVLTWLAQALIVINADTTKIEANSILIEKFDSMTLDQMLETVILQAQRVPWLGLDEIHLKYLKNRLDETACSGRRLGDMRYNEFYMKKGAKASISDWVNRLNGYIVKKEKCI